MLNTILFMYTCNEVLHQIVSQRQNCSLATKVRGKHEDINDIKLLCTSKVKNVKYQSGCCVLSRKEKTGWLGRPEASKGQIRSHRAQGSSPS